MVCLCSGAYHKVVDRVAVQAYRDPDYIFNSCFHFDYIATPKSSLTAILMGTKKNKLKKAISPTQPPLAPHVDDDLMDDLLAQLDSRDQTVQLESAAVINDIQKAETDIESHTRQDPKSRFKARQVRAG